MAGTTEYLPLAIAVGANVETQANFAGSSWQQMGFTTGTAKANQANKVWRQSSMMSAAWANVIINTLSQNVPDDGNLGNLVSQLQSTMNAIAQTALNASGLAQRVAALESLTSTHTSQIASLLSRVVALEGNYGNLSGRMSAAEGNIASNSNSINSLQSRMGTAEGNISNLLNSVNALNGQMASALGRIGNLEGAYNYMAGQISDLYNRVGTNANNIAANTNSINSLNSQIPPINNHLSTLDQQVSQLMPQGSLGQNGWTKLPNGLILQWSAGASQTSNGTQYQTIYFPTHFPNAVFQVQVSTYWSNGTDDDIMEYQPTGWNQDYVNLRRARRGNDNTMTTTPFIFAIGY